VELRCGEAEELQRILKGHVRHKPGNGPVETSTSQGRTADRPQVARVRGRQDQGSHISLQHSPTSNINHIQQVETSSNVIEIGPEGRWLLVCAGQRQTPPTLCQFDMCSAKSDREVFAGLKGFYTNMKGRFIHHVSMKTVRSIRFVQVRFACGGLASRKRRTLMLGHSSNYISETSSTFAKYPICHLNLEKMSTCTSPAISYHRWAST